MTRISFRGWFWIGYTVAFTVAAVTGCAWSQTPFHPSNVRDGVITISGARGGDTTLHRWAIAHAVEQGYRINIIGRCDSACALVLEHREAIRTGQIDIRRATFGIHAATRMGLTDREMTHEIMALYPQAALDAGRIPGPEAQTVRTFYTVPGRVVLAEMESE